MIDEVGWQVTYEYQGCVEIFVIFLDVVRIVLGRLPLVHCVKVNAGVSCLCGLEEMSESLLEAGSGQRAAIKRGKGIERTISDRFVVAEALSRHLRSFQRPA